MITSPWVEREYCTSLDREAGFDEIKSYTTGEVWGSYSGLCLDSVLLTSFLETRRGMRRGTDKFKFTRRRKELNRETELNSEEPITHPRPCCHTWARYAPAALAKTELCLPRRPTVSAADLPQRRTGRGGPRPVRPY